MAISFQCSGCAKRLHVKEELAGKRIKCPACAQVVVVPIRNPEVKPEETPLPRPTRARLVFLPWLIASLSGVLLIIIAVFWLSAESPAKAKSSAEQARQDLARAQMEADKLKGDLDKAYAEAENLKRQLGETKAELAAANESLSSKRESEKGESPSPPTSKTGPTEAAVPNAKAATGEKAVPTISYRVIEEWTIPNGGYGRIIVIEPTHRNEKDMRMLGDQLRSDTKKDRNAIIFVYDDEKAARMRKAALAERLNKKDLAHHDKHMIGDYLRNANTSFHCLKILLEGLDGPSLEVKY
jgi:hypothetical protein